MNLLGGILAAIALCMALIFAGYHARDIEAQKEAAIAKAAFEKTVSDANKAYANQKVQDDKELEALRQKATTAPANTAIVVKKDMAKRIGTIK